MDAKARHIRGINALDQRRYRALEPHLEVPAQRYLCATKKAPPLGDPSTVLTPPCLASYLGRSALLRAPGSSQLIISPSFPVRRFITDSHIPFYMFHHRPHSVIHQMPLRQSAFNRPLLQPLRILCSTAAGYKVYLSRILHLLSGALSQSYFEFERSTPSPGDRCFHYSGTVFALISQFSSVSEILLSSLFRPHPRKRLFRFVSQSSFAPLSLVVNPNVAPQRTTILEFRALFFTCMAFDDNSYLAAFLHAAETSTQPDLNIIEPEPAGPASRSQILERETSRSFPRHDKRYCQSARESSMSAILQLHLPFGTELISPTPCPLFIVTMTGLSIFMTSLILHAIAGITKEVAIIEVVKAIGNGISGNRFCIQFKNNSKFVLLHLV